MYNIRIYTGIYIFPSYIIIIITGVHVAAPNSGLSYNMGMSPIIVIHVHFISVSICSKLYMYQLRYRKISNAKISRSTRYIGHVPVE